MASTVRLSLNLPLPPRVPSTAVSLRGKLRSRVTVGKPIQAISQRSISDPFVLPVGGPKPVLITVGGRESFEVLCCREQEGDPEQKKPERSPSSKSVWFLMKKIRKCYKKMIIRELNQLSTDDLKKQVCFWALELGDPKNILVETSLDLQIANYVQDNCVFPIKADTYPVKKTVKHLMGKLRREYNDKLEAEKNGKKSVEFDEEICYLSRGLMNLGNIVVSSLLDVDILDYIEDKCNFGAKVHVDEKRSPPHEISKMSVNIDGVMERNVKKVAEYEKDGVIVPKLTRGAGLKKKGN